MVRRDRSAQSVKRGHNRETLSRPGLTSPATETALPRLTLSVILVFPGVAA